ncbi:hypothetical protein V500_02781 [Pseudogymnoascus sp. VKM F-4518 (FW-2643)]|nr:hypothetical protein V500_02781 [Pseudogymnoascus sp. VKM F-4518 (FW-2643)]
MSGYPGAGYGGGGGYGGPPQQYPPQQHYQSPPPLQYGGYAPPQQQYDGYQQGPPPRQQELYGASTTIGGYGGVPLNRQDYDRPGIPTANSNAYVHGNHQAPPPPPNAPQSFGQGAPQNYSFQYSNCTGRRKALLIGINYFGQRGQLRGCINDVKNMSSYLFENFGYKRENMVILTDDLQNPMSQPTKLNILRAMHWLVKDARPNDSLFFHYSGHGGQTKDFDGDEPDGYDEVIYPVNFRQVGHIVDDEMHRIMVAPMQPGVRLTTIFDSCHSGTALDLPYIYSTQGILKEPNLAKEAGQGLLGVITSYSRGVMGGVCRADAPIASRNRNIEDSPVSTYVAMFSTPFAVNERNQRQFCNNRNNGLVPNLGNSCSITSFITKVLKSGADFRDKSVDTWCGFIETIGW